MRLRLRYLCLGIWKLNENNWNMWRRFQFKSVPEPVKQSYGENNWNRKMVWASENLGLRTEPFLPTYVFSFGLGGCLLINGLHSFAHATPYPPKTQSRITVITGELNGPFILNTSIRKWQNPGVSWETCSYYVLAVWFTVVRAMMYWKPINWTI